MASQAAIIINGEGLYEDVRIGGIQLKAGDRLEPSRDLPEVGQFEYSDPPFKCMFWRMALDDRVSHKTPLVGDISLTSCILGIWVVFCSTFR